jgi:hypothetical protein
MGARARAVHRGADGSVHYLLSTPESSLLIVTDPVVGMTKIPFDGPCRLIPRSPLLPAGYDAVDYQSVGAEGSMLVSVRAGERPSIYGVTGLCDSCMAGPHDWSLWPVCPGEGERQVFGPPAAVPASEPVSVSGAVPDEHVGKEVRRRRFFEREPDPEPVPVPVPQVAPVVSVQVERAARALAGEVWRYGAQPRGRLLRPGLNPESAEQYLAHAVAQEWVRVDGDVLRPGVVDPRPVDVTDLAGIDSPAWGPWFG